MGKRGKVLIGLGCVVAVLATTLLVAYRSEPHYQGHTLTYWLGECAKEPSTGFYVFALGTGARQAPLPDTECVRAVRAIGTNAVPTLLAWLSYERSPAKRKLVTWLARRLGRSGRIPRWVVPEFGRNRLAAVGFAILGERSVSALPALANIATRTNREAALMAVFAMGKAGPAAVPFLETVLTNHAAIPRTTAAFMLGGLGTNAMPAVPTLVQCVNDPDELVAVNALWAVGAVRQDERVFAAVTGALNDPRPRFRMAALQALRSAGDKAAPFVERALDDPDKGVRYRARAILESLASQKLTNAPPQ